VPTRDRQAHGDRNHSGHARIMIRAVFAANRSTARDNLRPRIVASRCSPASFPSGPQRAEMMICAAAQPAPRDSDAGAPTSQMRSKSRSTSAANESDDRFATAIEFARAHRLSSPRRAAASSQAQGEVLLIALFMLLALQATRESPRIRAGTLIDAPARRR